VHSTGTNRLLKAMEIFEIPEIFEY